MIHHRTMDWESYTCEEVHRHYWDHDDNCAVTTLSIASHLFKTPLKPQVIEAALGMWGAGGYRAQCGLVEGALMFIGVLGSRLGLNRNEISEICKKFAENFEGEFGSLTCKELRPQGFAPDNPPHICEDLSKRAIGFTTHFVANAFQIEPIPPEPRP